MVEQQRDLNYYEEALDNFEQFCDEFEGAAARRFTGQDNDSRKPIEHPAVERITPDTIKEVSKFGAEDLQLRATPIDVQASEVTDTRELGGDVELPT